MLSSSSAWWLVMKLASPRRMRRSTTAEIAASLRTPATSDRTDPVTKVSIKVCSIAFKLVIFRSCMVAVSSLRHLIRTAGEVSPAATIASSSSSLLSGMEVGS